MNLSTPTDTTKPDASGATPTAPATDKVTAKQAKAAEKKAKLAEKKAKKSAPKKKRKITPKKIISLILVLAILGGGGYALYELFFVEVEAVALTDTITYGSLATVLEGTATTLPADSETYTVASSADIYEVAVSAGDSVEIGDLLYIQDDSDLDDTIDEYEDEILDEEDTLEDYYEQEDELLDSIAETTIVAPFSGKIININYEEGDDVNNGATLATMVDDVNMSVTQYFSYAYEDSIAVGTAAKVSVPDQMLVLDGTVTKVSKVDYVTAEGIHCFGVTVTVTNPGSLTDGLDVVATCVTSTGTTISPVDAGTLQYGDEEVITAGTSAELLGVYAEDYENITAGQVLFLLESDDLIDSLETVQSKIEATLERIEALEEKIADVNESREDYEVYSEIAGTVISVSIYETRTPVANMSSIMIYDMTTMQIFANIDELDIEYVTIGMPVDITYSTGSATTTYEAYISEVSYEATNSSGVAYFPVTITIDSAGALSAGVNVSYSIAIGDAQDGYMVPLDALKSTDEGNAVFVKADTAPDNAMELADGVVPTGFYAIPITIESVNTMYALVLDGLEEGMEVYTRYEEAAPSGGDTTSDTGEDDMSMMMMPGMEMSGMSGMSGMSSGGMSSGISGPGGR